MREYYRIGEISALFRIPVETLRYYDHENLLKPQKIASNGYRLYSSRQFERIATVITLRSADVPTAEIRALLGSKSIGEALVHIDIQYKELTARIENLEHIRNKLSTIRSQLRDVEKSIEPLIMLLPDLYLIAIPYRHNEEINGELDIEETRGVQQMMEPSWLTSASIFSTISKANLIKRKYHQYEHYGLLSETPIQIPNPLSQIIPSRQYVVDTVMVRTLNHDEVNKIYDRMIAHVKERGLCISGAAIERTVFDLEPTGSEEHIHYFSLMIPVEKEKNH